MKKFFRNGFLFAIPLIVYLIIIIIVDPYNYIRSFHIIDNDLKNDISNSVEPHLFRINNFQQKPTRNVVLGDSRSNALFRVIESSDWSDLAYGGGSIKEIIQTFWWATNLVKLDTVLIGINLNLYNKYNKRFWVEEILEINKNFFSYALSQYTFRSAYLFLKTTISKEEVTLGKPGMDKEKFWQHQLTNTAKKFYEKFSYPETYYLELKKIADYCDTNDIKLIFWIPPTHVDLQKKKSDFGLQEFDSIFISDLQSLGELYDFDYNSEITRNKDDYGDPMHFKRKIGKIVFSEITTGHPHYARYSDKIIAN